MNCALTILRTVTPLHVGTGQSAGAVDLPIARERATAWPVIPGSSFKGVLRDAAREANLAAGKGMDDGRGEIFGDMKQAGALSVSDQRMVLFPVRSYAGTFAYVTSPLAIVRLFELSDYANADLRSDEIAQFAVGEKAKVTRDTALKVGHLDDQRIFLEDLDIPYEVDGTGALENLANSLAKVLGITPQLINRRIAIVNDSIFTFLTETATEVVTHVSLEFETKTAKKGHLRNEEAVACEAVFAGLATGLNTKHDWRNAIKTHDGKLLQFGGKASVGMGLCRLAVLGGEN